MEYEKLKKEKNNKFKRATGIPRVLFEILVGVLVQSFQTEKGIVLNSIRYREYSFDNFNIL